MRGSPFTHPAMSMVRAWSGGTQGEHRQQPTEPSRRSSAPAAAGATAEAGAGLAHGSTPQL